MNVIIFNIDSALIDILRIVIVMDVIIVIIINIIDTINSIISDGNNIAAISTSISQP